MFSRFITDEVTLIKRRGEIYENIPAHVQTNLILIEDITVPIEEEDKLIRKLPNGLEEVYVVIDIGFYNKMGSINSHYQVKVKKENILKEKQRLNNNINNFYGNVSNAQIQQNVRNSTQSIVLNTEYDKKDELKEYIETLKSNINTVDLSVENKKIVDSSIKDIEREIDTRTYKSKVITEALNTIRNVLEGVTGSLIASGLIYTMGNLIK